MPAILSQKCSDLSQSPIRQASIRSQTEGAINLGQGLCDLPTPINIQKAAYTAMQNGYNTYSSCQGIKKLREQVAEKLENFNKISKNPEKEILITHGATGAFTCAATAIFEAGDEVLIFEPFYGYHNNILKLHGVIPKSIKISLKDLSFDLAEVEAKVSPKTKALIICSPNNPTGKVFSLKELEALGNIAEKHDFWIITDEIYEYFVYPGHKHHSIGANTQLANRTLTISGFSKTYNMTGWRLGYAAGPAALIHKMSLIQDLYYVCPSTPLQYALLAATDLPPTYYAELVKLYTTNRELMLTKLTAAGFKCTPPQGAYYLLADASHISEECESAADFLIKKAKVATVPGTAFYIDKPKNVLRFCFALNTEIVNTALEQILATVPHQSKQ